MGQEARPASSRRRSSRMPTGDLDCGERSSSRRRHCLHGLNLDLDADLVTDEEAPRFERLIPFQAPVAAIDFYLGLGARALASPGSLSPSAIGAVERHFLG